MLLIVGAKDKTVPYHQTLEMAEKLKAAGVPTSHRHSQCGSRFHRENIRANARSQSESPGRYLRVHRQDDEPPPLASFAGQIGFPVAFY